MLYAESIPSPGDEDKGESEAIRSLPGVPSAGGRAQKAAAPFFGKRRPAGSLRVRFCGGHSAMEMVTVLLVTLLPLLSVTTQ